MLLTTVRRSVAAVGGRGWAREVQGLRKVVGHRERMAVQQFRCFSSADEWIVNVPPLGDSITKGEVVEHLKGVGEYCFMDEEMVTIETDKVTFNVRAEQPGEIVEIYVPVNTEVKVGEKLLKMKKADAPAGGAPPSSAPEPKKEEKKAAPAKAAAPPASSAPAKPAAPSKPAASKAPADPTDALMEGIKFHERTERRVKLSPMRRKIAERLIDAQSTAAMLTTFNEIDMSALMKMRAEHKDQFEKVHGVRLGFMSAFVAAAAKSLQEIPAVNGVIDDKEIVYRDYCDISIAVSSPRGLVVPVIRNAEHLSFSEIEAKIQELGNKARNDQLTLEEMAGGTFTITNGGVFGSLMSTPMLNGTQSAILGMHAIKQRPIVDKSGQIVAAPMMYVALSYDHRLIDGRESVTFLKSLKQKVEEPERLLLGL